MKSACALCHSTSHSTLDCPRARLHVSEAEARERIRRVERGFWPKLRRWAGRLPFVRDAVALYHCMRDPLTPFWVKAAAAGALSYFISPVDMAPDLIPVLGFLDDAAVLAAVVWTVRSSLTEAHFARADEWLGGMGPAAPADDR